jgi:hypothetical protein
MKSTLVFSTVALLLLLAGCSDDDSTTAPTTSPSTPSGLAVTDSGLESIALSWDASSGATSYRLYRSATASGDYAQVHSGDLTEFTDTSLAFASTYYYRISAVNAGGESARSDSVSGSTQVPAGFDVSGSPQGAVDYTFDFHQMLNGKPWYQSDPIGLNIMVPSTGDHAGQWCFHDQIEGVYLYYHPTVSDYPPATGWRANLGDGETTIQLTAF